MEKTSIMVTLALLVFAIFAAVHAFTQVNDSCDTNFDASQIKEISINENAKLVSNEIEIEINKPVGDVFKWVVYKPLEQKLRGTDKIPGVRTTTALNDKAPGTIGYRRLVCLEDGNSAVEEFMENKPDNYFSYKVWNYSLKMGQNIEYAKGEWWFTPIGDKTHIRWRYCFKLNSDKLIGKTGCCGRWLFDTFFVKTRYNDWMIKTLNDLKKDIEI